MLKSLAIISLLSAVAAANAQSNTTPDPQITPAPIVRTYPAARALPSNHSAFRQPHQADEQIVETQPIPGIWLRSQSTNTLQTVSATPKRTELRLDRGRLNVTVHHPADHAEILVDLPGGQVSLLKDGLYTFNANTNTVRVLRGEAAAYAGPISANANTKPIKIKEDHELSLIAATGESNANPSGLKSIECYPYELTADLLRPATIPGDEDRGYASYGEGYPYYAGAYGYPRYYAGYYPGYYGFGYPFSSGIGFGYYGGFHGGYGYRGSFHR